jgi:hypothetical protein
MNKRRTLHKLCSNQTKDIKGYSEAVNRRTDNIMIKMKKGQKRQLMVDKTRHRQLDAEDIPN